MRSLSAASRAYGGARVSQQRQAIAAVAAGLPGAFTIEDLATALRRHRVRAGMATVYRAVAALRATGWLEHIGERDGSALFARCAGGEHHHHHAVCGDCGRVVAIPCPGVGKTPQPDKRHGFVVMRHEVTLHGLCAECRPSRGARR
jgi:Fur family ferric uptake transcriptional regulator